ncbi:MAG: hypothetical protein AB7P99_07200 [Vicinamibacterales bacterium]
MPRCADTACGRWRPERLVPGWSTGLRYNGHWFCSRTCVENAARTGFERPAIMPPAMSALPPLRLGVLLRHVGAVTEAHVTAALDAQRASGRRLGRELCSLRVVEPDAVLRALATQAGVSYMASFDVRRVRRDTSGLAPETVRALGLIPFEADEAKRLLKVICVAPVPRIALRALHQLTGWTPEPFLVDDATWEQAARLYRTDRPVDAATVGTVDAVASRVADAAAAQRSITVKSAAVDNFTWVRIEGARQVSDLLVEEPCLAAPIAR